MTRSLRSTLYTLFSTLILLASCAPADLPPQPTPRIIFPTDRPAATRTATPTPTPTPTPRPTPAAPPLTEYRALWVDGFTPGLQTAEQVTQLVHDCQSISCNMLLVQIRIHANALHAQSSEPRSADFPETAGPARRLPAASLSPRRACLGLSRASSAAPNRSGPTTRSVSFPVCRTPG